MSAINVNSITGRTGTHGPVLTGVTTATNGLNVTGGNVGIGLTNPTGKLHTIGDVMIQGEGGTGEQSLFIGKSATVLPNSRGVAVAADQNASAFHDMVLKTSTNSSGLVERVRITSAGEVGIGTDNPITKVHIQSTNASGDLEVDRIDSSQNGPELILRHISSSPANNDYIGQITFSGRDDANNNTTVARIDGVMSNVVNGSESGEIVFNTRHNGTFSEKARFNSTGNLAFASGNGIDFSATSGSGTSELLDDYEEGTFTPLLRGSTGNPTYTVATQRSSYTKIGRLVNCNIDMSFNIGGSGSGSVYVTLPFACEDNSQKAYTELVSARNNSWFTGANNTLVGFCLDTTNQGYFRHQNGNGGSEAITTWVTDTNTGDVRIAVQWIYYTNS